MNDSNNPIARRVVIHGRVQGVGFRWEAQREARRCGVVGWVTNHGNGTVEAHLEGAPSMVEALEGWFARGPSGARVERVEARDADPENARLFEVRR